MGVWHRDPSRLGWMLEMMVTTLNVHEDPAVVFEPPDEVGARHRVYYTHLFAGVKERLASAPRPVP